MVVKVADENRIVGELLVAKGIISREQVSSALAIQEDKPHLRIGEILLSMGLITIEQLDRILREHLSQQFIGSLLLSNGFISQEQLANAMALRERTSRRLGEIFVELGYVTEYQLNMLLEKQRVMRRPTMSGDDSNRKLAKKTKLIATIGPSCKTDDNIRQLIQEGANLFRLNFSHGEHADHADAVSRVRKVAAELGETVGIIQDIQGPKIRIGEVEGGEVVLENGARFELVVEPTLATARRASVSYARLLEDIKPGALILIDDGKLELDVVGVEDDALVTRVRTGGSLKPRKGVNFPGSVLGISVLTDKDKSDLRAGIEMGIDWVAVSFVQTAEDIKEVRSFIQKNGGNTPLIAKIETHEAVYNLQEILGVADGVMVARGDLGVEFPTEDVPLIQKQIIRQANIAGKPVITATQMLDSMVQAPRPTRAEASDVANAILDGTDAVMLSNETAAGKYPIQAVQTMRRIIEKTEQAESARMARDGVESQKQLPEAIVSAATRLVSEVGAAAIVVPSYRGASARLVANFRPQCVVIATSSNIDVCRQMTLIWGVYPLHLEEDAADEELHPHSITTAVHKGLLNPGDFVVVMEIVHGGAGRSRGIRVEKVPEFSLPITGLKR